MLEQWAEPLAALLPLRACIVRFRFLRATAHGAASGGCGRAQGRSVAGAGSAVLGMLLLSAAELEVISVPLPAAEAGVPEVVVN